MQCVLITNPAESYKNTICDYLHSVQSLDGYSFSTNSQTFNNSITGQASSGPKVIIDSFSVYSDKNSFRGIFDDDSETNAVFIVPELWWDDVVSVEYGYKIALEILGGKVKKLKNKFFNLIFISVYDRGQLLSEVSPEYAKLVKSFPHISLNEIRLGKNPSLHVPVYTEFHFELLKRIVLPGPGRLSHIKHQLPQYSEQPIKDKCRIIRNILDELALPAYGGLIDWEMTKISEFRKRNEEISAESEAVTLIKDIGDFIEHLKDRLVTGNHNSKHKLNYKVLIIEDNKSCRKQLKTFFEDYFNDVEVLEDDDELFCCTGDGMSNAKRRIAEIAGSKNIVVLDLLYASNMYDDDTLPFNGFDLYNFLRSEESKILNYKCCPRRKAAVRIVTSLPRYEVSCLVKKHFDKETPVIFTKGYGWPQLEGFLKDGMDELIRECEKNDKISIKALQAPKTALFLKPGVLDAIFSHRKILDDAVRYSQKVASKKMRTSDKVDWSLTKDDSPEVILQHLNAIMAHRRLVIMFIKKNDGHFKESEYKDFLSQYLPPEAILEHYNKDYLSTRLGFSIYGATGSDFQCMLNLKNTMDFFDEECDLLDPSRKWVKAVAAFLESVISGTETVGADAPFNCSLEMKTEAFKKAGICLFLKNKTEIWDMLLEADKFIHDNTVDRNLRMWLRSLFCDEKIFLGRKGDEKWKEERICIKKEYKESIYKPYLRIVKAFSSNPEGTPEF